MERMERMERMDRKEEEGTPLISVPLAPPAQPSLVRAADPSARTMSDDETQQHIVLIDKIATVIGNAVAAAKAANQLIVDSTSLTLHKLWMADQQRDMVNLAQHVLGLIRQVKAVSIFPASFENLIVFIARNGVIARPGLYPDAVLCISWTEAEPHVMRNCLLDYVAGAQTRTQPRTIEMASAAPV